ncbi:DUF4097 domain-containing protein [Streptomyces sp. NPDC057638]|uniref:DUF4097 family beta strand repeat-containing protein n=1 Tax=Streptomyces sp. NPDC057638 TaxID=3346190 RepID=UPI00369664A3
MTETTWEVAEPRKLTFDTPLTALDIRVVNGTVNVVGTDEGSPRLEVSHIEGPPLVITRTGSSLTVSYADLSWKGWLRWLDRKGWHREVTVSLAVPTRTRVRVGVVGAGAVISGIQGATSVQSVDGDATLVRISGEVQAETVSGDLEAQSLSGGLRYNSVSGHLTVIEGAPDASFRADSISGDMLVDLADGGGAARPADIALSTVSGEIAIRLPGSADATVEVDTTGGSVSNAFTALRVSDEWGTKRIRGRLGPGAGTLKATTMSGSVALLRGPGRSEDDGADADGGTDGDGRDGGDASEVPTVPAPPTDPADPADLSGKVL